MPKVFKPVEISPDETAARKDYFDRHTPHIICDSVVKRGGRFCVKVRIGENYQHPDDADHYIKFIQLWNLETFVAEVQFAPGAQGGVPSNVEVDFYLTAKNTMYLSVLSACTKHGLWHSEEVKVCVTD